MKKFYELVNSISNAEISKINVTRFTNCKEKIPENFHPIFPTNSITKNNLPIKQTHKKFKLLTINDTTNSP